MGLLLLQYEYQRANNQVNLCERTGIRLKDQLDRYTKRVSKMEELFNKQKSNLDNRYNQMQQLMYSNLSAASMCTDWGQFVANVGSMGNIGSIDGTQLLGMANVTDPGSDTKAVTAAIASASANIRQLMAALFDQLKQFDMDRLEYQQEQQLDPIKEKEDEYTQKSSSNDVLLTLWEKRRDGAKEKLGQSTQDFGKFGIA